MVHRPGKELDRLTVSNKDSFLFDDLLWVEEAQKEHDSFVQTLRESGAQVVYLKDYLQDIVRMDAVRRNMITDICKGLFLERPLSERLTEILLDIPVQQFTQILLAGLTKGEFSEFSGSTTSLTLNSMDNDAFLVSPLPNLYFQRDPYLIIGNRVVISNMNYPARRRESLYGRYIFQNHPDFADLEIVFGTSQEDILAGTVEGGDILILSDDLVAAGISERTSTGAIHTLGSRLSREGVCNRILAIDIPKTRSAMHLDTVFTMIDKRTFTIYKGIYDLLRIWLLEFDEAGILTTLKEYNNLEYCLSDCLEVDNIRFIETGGSNPVQAARDQWNDGANVFAVAPGKVITYGRNVVTNKTLVDMGVKVLEIRGSELGRGRGGPRCMTMPLSREDI
jgi:arginine deiminase